ncbi:MAG TPA: tetratricopeptide repeat protein, partial [Bryobacteraceae bacterium]|nr:tetratricopeptide repeat protein [Bryobacteraceae bacterium]
DFESTATHMRKAVELRPSYAAAHYMLGTALKQKGELDSALRALREAVRLDASDPGPHNTIGQILKMQGDLEGSRLAFAEGSRLKHSREAEQARMLRSGKR